MRGIVLLVPCGDFMRSAEARTRGSRCGVDIDRKPQLASLCYGPRLWPERVRRRSHQAFLSVHGFLEGGVHFRTAFSCENNSDVCCLRTSVVCVGCRARTCFQSGAQYQPKRLELMSSRRWKRLVPIDQRACAMFVVGWHTVSHRRSCAVGCVGLAACAA